MLTHHQKRSRAVNWDWRPGTGLRRLQGQRALFIRAHAARAAVEEAEKLVRLKTLKIHRRATHPARLIAST